MRRIVYIAQSLDGYIADKNGGIDWLNEIPNPDKSDFGFTAFMDGIDAIVMGRNTFEQVQSFGMWPYTKPVFVISSTLKELHVDFAGKAEILNASPSEIVQILPEKGFQNLYIDGGALIQSFLHLDLIDELIITTVPVILGAGISLFGKTDSAMNYKLMNSQLLVNHLVKTHYRRER